MGYGMGRIAVVAVLAASVWVQGARAESIGPEKAAEMLAHAWMIDNRCNVLGGADRDTLTNLVARAELLLAEKQSVAEAREAIGRGRASGTSAPCDSSSASDVQTILRAAKSAAAGLGTEFPSSGVPSLHSLNPPSVPAPKPVVKPPEKIPVAKVLLANVQTDATVPPAEVPMAQIAHEAMPEEPERVAVAIDPAAVIVKVRKPVKTTALAPKLAAKPKAQALVTRGYAVTAEAYYRQLRCRTKPMKAMNAMYAEVLRQHREAVAASGKAAVRTLLKAAEARAARTTC